MAAIEAKHVFSDGQTVAINAAASATSTNVVRLATGKTYRRYTNAATKFADPSDVGKLRLLVKVTDELLEAAADGAVLTIKLMKHTTSAVGSGTEVDSKAVTVNTAGTGATAIGTTLWDIGLPVDELDEEYFGIEYDVATQNIDTGKIFAALMDGAEKTSEEPV